MSALEPLFSEDECTEISAMAADARLSPEELVRGIVLEFLDTHRVADGMEKVEQGEEPTMDLDELCNCPQKPSQ